MINDQRTQELIEELLAIIDKDFPSKTDFEKAIQDKVSAIEKDCSAETLSAILRVINITALIGKSTAKSSKSTFN